jgi:hypothetical protein
MPVYRDELWLGHCSCMSWLDAARWKEYFSKVEEILGAAITHLDENDPLRRRVQPGHATQFARYMISFGQEEGSRIVFGKMASIRATFTISHYRNYRDPGFANSIDWYFPPVFAENASRLAEIRSLFDCGNTVMSPFYAYSDAETQITIKNQEWAVDLEAELLGVFWLTYFNDRYVEFIGKDKFEKLRRIGVKFNGGATLDLGESPRSVPEGLRAQAQGILGRKLFVEPEKGRRKRRGTYALTYEQLCCP